MLSISPIPGDGSYYTSQGTGEYYLQGGEPCGVWIGKGAQHLGLSGTVSDDHFRNVLDGYSPDRKREWIQNAGHETRQRGWDLTFSAPKSVSVLWSSSEGVANMEVLIREAHRLAVERAMAYLEGAVAWGRTGKGGVGRAPLTLVAAAFEHGANRDQEAQLHTHVVLANVGVGPDGATRTLLSQKFYQAKMTAGALYRAELGYQLRTRLGLELEAERNWFELSGIPKSLIKASSSRRARIQAKLNEWGVSSAKASEIAALDTRSPKEIIPRIFLFLRWKTLAEQHGLTPERLGKLTRPELKRATREVTPQLVAEQVERITQQRSYFSERELTRAVAEQVQALGVSVDQIVAQVRRSLEKLISLGIHREERQYTTPLMLALEKDLVERAVSGARNYAHSVDRQRAEAAIRTFGLGREQGEALRHITIRSGTVSVVEGLAGTGKSTLLKAARIAWESDGFNVVGCSTSGKAAEGLQVSSGIRSRTIASLLLQWGRSNPNVPPLNRKSILVVDEASMVGTKVLSELYGHVLRAGAKLVLVGDSKQLPAIDAGTPFRVLGEVLGHAELKDIKRQHESWNREMVRSFADGNVKKGLETLVKRGLVHITDTAQDRTESLFTQWKKEKDFGKVIILAGTREEVAQLNREAQKRRWSGNEVGTMPSLIGENLFYSGDRVIFTRNDRRHGVKNGTLGTVKNSWGRGMSVTLDDGKVVQISALYKHVSLGYAVTTHKSQGMTVDKAFVVVSDAMQNLESSYVQVSRARSATHLFMTQSQAGEHEMQQVIRDMGRALDKRSAVDLIPDWVHSRTPQEREEKERRERSRQIEMSP